jgi:hypothetical protein
VDSTPIVTTHAPAPSKADIAPTLERLVGELVAAAGMAIAEALAERSDGGLTPATRVRGGDLIAQLYGLRQFLIVDFPNFDSIARTHGLAALRACDVPPATADVLVNEVLAIVAKVVRASGEILC